MDDRTSRDLKDVQVRCWIYVERRRVWLKIKNWKDLFKEMNLRGIRQKSRSHRLKSGWWIKRESFIGSEIKRSGRQRSLIKINQNHLHWRMRLRENSNDTAVGTFGKANGGGKTQKVIRSEDMLCVKNWQDTARRYKEAAKPAGIAGPWPENIFVGAMNQAVSVGWFVRCYWSGGEKRCNWLVPWSR